MTKSKVLELIQPIVIAEIKSVAKHPDADRLYIVKINAGDASDRFEILNQVQDDDKTIQIVTAADNMGEGDLVPYLMPGQLVPGAMFADGSEFRLESRKMRGEISHGMILAEDEVGISDDHGGIILVNNSNEQLTINNDQKELVGKSFVEVLSEETLEVIMNRAGVVEMTPEIQEKYDLIIRNLEETIGEDEIPQIIAERPIKIYWGTATTGKPSLAYLLPMTKLADFLNAGAEVTVLIANMHGFLDNMKSTWEVLEYRVEFYEMLIKEILTSIGVSIDKLKFIRGKDFQLEEKYTLDMYKIATQASIRDLTKAGSEVVKQVESPMISNLLYPILQALDEEYLGVDVQLGGLDQRKIFTFAREYLPRLGYKKRIHLMNPLIPGLTKTGKMSSSEPNSKIDFDDTDDVITEKINKAYSVDGEVEGNGLLAIFKYLVFYKLEVEGRTLEIERPEKWGGNVEYSSYNEMESDFVAKKLSSVDLKPALIKEIINIIQPIRSKLAEKSELISKAYSK